MVVITLNQVLRNIFIYLFYQNILTLVCSSVSRGHHAKQQTAATDRRNNGQIWGWQKRRSTHLQGSHQSICWLRPKRARHFLGKPGSECKPASMHTQKRKEQKEDRKRTWAESIVNRQREHEKAIKVRTLYWRLQNNSVWREISF